MTYQSVLTELRARRDRAQCLVDQLGEAIVALERVAGEGAEVTVKHAKKHVRDKSCRTCGQQFTPHRHDQVRCGGCVKKTPGQKAGPVVGQAFRCIGSPESPNCQAQVTRTSSRGPTRCKDCWAAVNRDRVKKAKALKREFKVETESPVGDEGAFDSVWNGRDSLTGNWEQVRDGRGS